MEISSKLGEKPDKEIDMQLVYVTENNIVKKVRMECTPGDWLIINTALKQFAEDDYNYPIDVETVESMLETKPIYEEVKDAKDSD